MDDKPSASGGQARCASTSPLSFVANTSRRALLKSIPMCNIVPGAFFAWLVPMRIHFSTGEGPFYGIQI